MDEIDDLRRRLKSQEATLAVVRAAIVMYQAHLIALEEVAGALFAVAGVDPVAVRQRVGERTALMSELPGCESPPDIGDATLDRIFERLSSG